MDINIIINSFFEFLEKFTDFSDAVYKFVFAIIMIITAYHYLRHKKLLKFTIFGAKEVEINKDVSISSNQEEDEKKEESKEKIDINDKYFILNNLYYETKEFKDIFTFEEAKEYIKNLNSGGFNNWRMPTQKELIALLTNYYGENNSSWYKWDKKDKASLNKNNHKQFAIKEIRDYLPKNGYFWTQDIDKKDKRYQWTISFNYGASETILKDNSEKHFVLAVRD